MRKSHSTLAEQPLQHIVNLQRFAPSKTQPRLPPLRASTDTDANVVTTLERRDELAQAIRQTGLLVGCALAFGCGVLLVRGPEDGTAWFAAYILEESLSVDNLFVFSLIFDYFKTPSAAQPRVLRWGLIVAVFLRAAFIFAGLAAVERFKGVLLIFAGLLIYSSYSLLTGDAEEEEDLSQNAVVQFTQKYLPSSSSYDDERFITKADGATSPSAGTALGLIDGSSLVTPLLLALVCVEISDVLFAVDSIPAVFGVTSDPFIALSSNAFALFGLRALYTVVAQAVNDFQYLETSIALVLGFIGAKLVGEFCGFEVSTVISLLVVVATLGTGVAASILTADSEAKDKGD